MLSSANIFIGLVKLNRTGHGYFGIKDKDQLYLNYAYRHNKDLKIPTKNVTNVNFELKKTKFIHTYIISTYIVCLFKIYICLHF